MISLLNDNPAPVCTQPNVVLKAIGDPGSPHLPAVTHCLTKYVSTEQDIYASGGTEVRVGELGLIQMFPTPFDWYTM